MRSELTIYARVNRSLTLIVGLLSCSLFAAADIGSGVTNPCDLNQDGSINVVDVQLATNMDLGLMTCTADINGPNVCNTTVVQRVLNAALGQSCVVNHSVQLNWTASTSSVAGYNVYRGTAAAGPFAVVNTSLIDGTTFTDSTVASGQTYYYVAVAVDASNNQSINSNVAQAVVPTP
jgi:hypothetical protein